ncbi:hypothetical protein AV521_05035 [Streptomyces sp. IMTB 2501]|uniref:hypothetical protein n=1 Tax=Streptomyces sp. IMTB 2501 TaxID=1776340 RepID=UPI00096D7D09|nr:hypothetical protein [Streptomyces sp. IMTB 2501]OLZ73437.1 hypothetical protein AV521_05035 [Streptomyces sp. IMTB 2501]
MSPGSLLSHVDYRTSRLLDMAAITEAVQRHGAQVVWDLCRSAGVLPIQLGFCQADFDVAAPTST